MQDTEGLRGDGAPLDPFTLRSRPRAFCGAVTAGPTGAFWLLDLGCSAHPVCFSWLRPLEGLCAPLFSRVHGMKDWGVGGIERQAASS